MEFEQTEKQLTELEISEFEKTNGINLPEDFIQHYLNYNGGYPPYEYVKGVRNIFTINGFNSLKYGSLPIEQIIADYRKSGIIFEKKIPFAYDNGGNVFVISENGQVHIIEAEFLADKKFILVSETFTDFLNSFYNE
ncbi:SMI1/KNR4 family protein [Chryseobacterium fluminis]|uniref:SMI1/KNR4 family protein n=1 Tax=Chryseobacterium fluminis TaxID=2983606 RepID=UPI00224CD218|nr:SMI1/KNR4 family protein [Chryseobacterium sp. MMS21-Ot14]UZT97377.1 SMI1/KNR4 family protein [Chryseobacterium sp. MMS21-Ot14]